MTERLTIPEVAAAGILQNPAVPLPDLLTTSEVAHLCRTPSETVRYWRHIGKGPRSFKVGRRVLYRREDVESWVEEQYVSQGPGAA